jgi:hypothetical protein
MAKKDKKAPKAAKKQPVPAVTQSSAASTSTAQKPPAELMNLVETFLSDQGFEGAHREFQKQRATKAWEGHTAGKSDGKQHHSLVGIFQTWETFASKDSTPNAPAQITKVSSESSSESSSDSSSDDESSDDESSDDDDVAMADAPAVPTVESSSSESSSSSSESESDSSSDEEESAVSKQPASKVKPPAKSLKRKAESDADSSSSESDSDEEMSSSDSKGAKAKPHSKKLKTQDSSDESSSESSSESDSSDQSSEDSSDDSSDDEKAKPKQIKPIQTGSASSSESESDFESDSESEVKLAAKVPLPESDSDSSSESEAEPEADEQKTKKVAAAAPTSGAVSDSSVTLDKASPEFAPLPPDPTMFKANNRGKNGAAPKRSQNQPFSRISKDVVVDPRLSSNAYVTHGYGEQAHRDLIVTKGKGFTKEKNKKKRGSYKGGPLDVHTSRSFKFDD